MILRAVICRQCDDRIAQGPLPLELVHVFEAAGGGRHPHLTLTNPAARSKNTRITRCSIANCPFVYHGARSRPIIQEELWSFQLDLDPVFEAGRYEAQGYAQDGG